jgi:catechol 2,3-dioxygenase-like lactoylglutathione lyase family enzyme
MGQSVKALLLSGILAAVLGLGFAGAQHAVPTEQVAEPAKDPTKIAPPVERVPIDIRRTTIIVRDMETSLKLYRDGLGMRVNYDERMNVSSPALAQGGPPRPIRLVLLNANDPWIGWIGLIQYTDHPNQPKIKQPQVLGPGSHIMVAAVADAQKACDAAKAAPGVRMVVEPKISIYPPRIPGTRRIAVLGCQFFDADGAYLELNQTLPQ